MAIGTNIKGFRQVIYTASPNGNSDYSRSYMFSLDIPQMGFNSIEQQIAGDLILTSFCRSTNLPNFKINTEEYDFSGIKLQVAQSVKFDTSWTVEFLSDDNFLLKRRILSWMGQVVDPARMIPSIPESYKSDSVKATQLNRDGLPLMTYSFKGLFPVEIMKTANFDHSKTAPDNFSVRFTFDYFTVEFFDVQSTPDDVDSQSIPAGAATAAANAAAKAASKAIGGKTIPQ